jgi:hypothetical protein
MTGIVLVLAGLTCGDGGQGTVAAREPITLHLAEGWEGTWETGSGNSFRAVMRGGVIDLPGTPDEACAAVSVLGAKDGSSDAKVKVVFTSNFVSGTGCGLCKAEPGRLLICFTIEAPPPRSFRLAPGTILVTLKPTPRKP